MKAIMREIEMLITVALFLAIFLSGNLWRFPKKTKHLPEVLNGYKNVSILNSTQKSP